MLLKKKLLQNTKIYLIVDVSLGKPSTLLRKTKQVLKAGVKLVQLRAKNISDKEFLNIASDFRKITQDEDAVFIINDRVDIALSCEADGVHLGQDDLPIIKARTLLGKSAIIGKSTHTLKQALAAQTEDIDYIGFGPIFKTKAKPSVKPLGTEQIEKMARWIRIPFFPIGGISQNNIEEVAAAGAKGIAVSRAIISKRDIKNAVRALMKSMET